MSGNCGNMSQIGAFSELNRIMGEKTFPLLWEYNLGRQDIWDEMGLQENENLPFCFHSKNLETLMMRVGISESSI